MKKIILNLFGLIIVFMPFNCYATVLDEIPPYIKILGINEDDYKITKTIKDDEIIIDLVEKKTNLNYSWSFDKNKINSTVTLDFTIDFQSKKKQEIDNILKDKNKLYLSFAHHGGLPGVAKIKVDVSNKFKEGSTLSLYYYNESTGELEFVDNEIKVAHGYAEFEIEHCSEYVLTEESTKDTISKMRILSYAITVLGVLVLILITYTLFRK